jgi:hypothetical protein
VSPSDAAASRARRGEGSGTGTQSSDDVTKPHGFVAEVDDEQDDRLTKSSSSSWSETDRRETVQLEAAASSAFPAPPAYGSLGPAGAPPGGYGPAAGSVHSGPAGQAHVTPQNRGVMARRARLKIAHLGPLSVLRISLTFALCMFIVLLVAVAALWAVLDTSGVFKSIIDAATTLTNDKNHSGLSDWLGFGRVMLITVVLGAANVIAFTLLSTIGALLYNLCSDFVGGVEVTLVER